MRMLLNTNILVRATPASLGGPSWAILQYAASGSHVLVTSPPLLIELADVLSRPRLARLHGLSDEAIVRYVTPIEQMAVVVSLPPSAPLAVPDDPKDTAVVHTALVGDADVICTRDRHLYHDLVCSYCATHGIQIMDDLNLVRLLRRDAPTD